jgi:DNA excision repair protein ERCC-2
MYPGINRVLQAAGRVIRSETDRGVVLLIDQRYGHEHYHALLPGHWQPRRVRDQAELTVDLSGFWGSAATPEKWRGDSFVPGQN